MRIEGRTRRSTQRNISPRVVVEVRGCYIGCCPVVIRMSVRDPDNPGTRGDAISRDMRVARRMRCGAGGLRVTSDEAVGLSHTLPTCVM